MKAMKKLTKLYPLVRNVLPKDSLPSRSVRMEDGVKFVILTSPSLMQLSCAGSWDTLTMVR